MEMTKELCLAVVLLVGLSVAVIVQVRGQVTVRELPDGTRYGAIMFEDPDSPLRVELPCGSYEDCSQPIWVVQSRDPMSTIRLLRLRRCGATQTCPEPGPGGDPWPGVPGCGPPQSCPEPGPALLRAIERGYLQGEGIVLSGAALRRVQEVLR